MGCGASAHPEDIDDAEDSAVAAELAAAGWFQPGPEPPKPVAVKRAEAVAVALQLPVAAQTLEEGPGTAATQPPAKVLLKGWSAEKALIGSEGGTESLAVHASSTGKSNGHGLENCHASTPSNAARTSQSVLDELGGFERALIFAERVPLFKEIPKADLPLIVKSMEAHEYAPGATLIRQGEMTDRLFIVVAGEAEAVRVKRDPGGAEGPPRKLRTLSSGDCFGARGLLLAEEARATVRATGEQPLCAYSIEHDVFWTLNLHERLHIPKRRHLRGQHCEDNNVSSSPCSKPVKTESEHDFLISALRANVYLPSMCEITEDSLQQLVTAAARHTAFAGEVLFRQGDMHIDRFCIVESGAFEMRAEPSDVDAIAELAGSVGLPFGSQRFGEAGSWQAIRKAKSTFGEMELFYSLPARATVTAVEPSVFWAVGRSSFKKILAVQMEVRLARYVKALRDVQVFSGLWNEEIQALAAGVTEVSYVKGEDVITQGEVSNACYVLVQGDAVKLRDGVETEKRYSDCNKHNEEANFFGSREFLQSAPRHSTVRIESDTARVLYIDKETCELILPSLEHLVMPTSKPTPGPPPSTVVSSILARECSVKSLSQQLKEVSTLHTIPASIGTSSAQTSRAGAGSLSSNCMQVSVKVEDLECIGNLGTGQFGYVDLAVEKSTGRRFALKRLHRKHFSDPAHRSQVKMERWILSMTHSPFLVRLYATYKERRSLAFLLELVAGGDLRHALYRDGVCGNMDCARFYCAGVLLAVEHLHVRHIVHRDLKPDNVLLDEKGWPKVTDLGLAKFCIGKTYTLVGTPNYMAPEVFQAAGHGLSVDWWSLGCLIYELMAGKTPFESKLGNFQALFKNINKGIQKPEAWRWPENFGPHLPRLLFCLLQTDPTKRLPARPGGIAKIQSHLWYSDFNWAQFKDGLLEPPLVPPSLGSLKPCKSSEESDEEDEVDFWDDDSDIGELETVSVTTPKT